ncbi:hypothetical protein WJX84_007114 [Apatococcus fuscideae]|uniref:Uncharacterized protein n=1 Tax=Apatococcus fuscideae TaxID=2026836 RepID=A0AAW1TEK2_9CHLO
MADLNEQSELSEEQFADLLKKIDNGLRALPATAQVAKQQGRGSWPNWMHKIECGQRSPCQRAPRPSSTATRQPGVCGKDRAVMDVPGVSPLTGYGAGEDRPPFPPAPLYEIQISFRNLFLVSVDWVRTKVFGRDISRV